MPVDRFLAMKCLSTDDTLFYRLQMLGSPPPVERAVVFPFYTSAEARECSTVKDAQRACWPQDGATL